MPPNTPGPQNTAEELLFLEIAILPRQADALLPSDAIVKPWRETHAPPQLAVVLRDDAEAIATSLALRRPGNALGTDTVPVLVHQTREDRLLSRLGEAEVRNHDMTRLVAIGGLVRAASIERVLDRKGDEMARSMPIIWMRRRRLGRIHRLRWKRGTACRKICATRTAPRPNTRRSCLPLPGFGSLAQDPASNLLHYRARRSNSSPELSIAAGSPIASTVAGVITKSAMIACCCIQLWCPMRP
jgi:hypothetical protein